VVTSNNEVGSAVILADDGVPDGLTRTTHAHSKRQESQHSHTIRVARHQRLVDADTCEVIDVTRLGETDNGVDQDIGLASPRSANSQLTMSAVHRIPGLESNNLLPAELVEVQTQLRRRISQTDIVVVLQAVNRLELSTNVVLLRSVEKVLDRWVLLVAAKDLLGLLLLVWLVYVVDGDDGEVAVVTEVAQRNARARLYAHLLDCLL
tara:strand:- start:8922 stop:9542 length:621 start_codon:yes stop_codon:yes gene_type:complete